MGQGQTATELNVGSGFPENAVPSYFSVCRWDLLQRRQSPWTERKLFVKRQSHFFHMLSICNFLSLSKYLRFPSISLDLVCQQTEDVIRGRCSAKNDVILICKSLNHHWWNVIFKILQLTYLTRHLEMLSLSLGVLMSYRFERKYFKTFGLSYLSWCNNNNVWFKTIKAAHLLSSSNKPSSKSSLPNRPLKINEGDTAHFYTGSEFFSYLIQLFCLFPPHSKPYTDLTG